MKLAVALKPSDLLLRGRGVRRRAPRRLTAAGARRRCTRRRPGSSGSITGAYGALLHGRRGGEAVSPHADSGRKAMEHPGEELVFESSAAVSTSTSTGITHRLGPGDALHFRDRPSPPLVQSDRRARPGGLDGAAADVAGMTTPVDLPESVTVVNVGLGLLADAVRRQGRTAVQVDGRIPAGGDLEVVAMLRRLFGPRTAAVDAANAEVVRRFDEGVPMSSRSSPPGRCPGLGERTVLHCGRQIAWEEMCDPLRRSVRSAIVVEGWADSPSGGRAPHPRRGRPRARQPPSHRRPDGHRDRAVVAGPVVETPTTAASARSRRSTRARGRRPGSVSTATRRSPG